MKKTLVLLCILLCLCISGCSNTYAKEEYDSLEKLTSQGDRYSKSGSIFNPIEGGYSFTVSKFDGRQTLHTWNLSEDKELSMEIICSLTDGTGKLVHVDADGNVTTLVECDKDTSAAVIRTISLKQGRNDIKFVGYDCEKLDLKMYFDEP
ncbi:MAG: hypothetical protein IJ420_07345 [Lachnospiraceae bacterium]|nr:hypothetical protein [Lachnospiraceae bacterium]